MKRLFRKKFIKILSIIAGILFLLVIGINIYVVKSTEKQIVKEVDSGYDCILVLGAGVKNGSPKPMLEHRLDYAIDLYNKGVSSKIIMSGDHGRKDYDEVNVMKSYAIEKGVPSQDIFMDHAGFSTYESIYRAKEIFKVRKMVIVTQEYHLYRALYIANQFSIDAVGYASDPRSYSGQFYREIREIIARDKDFMYCIFKPKPTYLGNAIPVSGNGDQTNDLV